MGRKRRYYDMVTVEHVLCGRRWRVSTNSLELVYCIHCQVDGGIKVIKDDKKEAKRR